MGLKRFHLIENMIEELAELILACDLCEHSLNGLMVASKSASLGIQLKMDVLGKRVVVVECLGTPHA